MDEQQNISKRVMLKVSGEQLGSDEYNFDIERAGAICNIIEALIGNGYQLACVMGGGNIVRGAKLQKNGFSNAIIADQMGMLATIQNGLFLSEILNQRGHVAGRLFSNIPIDNLAESFSYKRAIKYMQEGKAVLIAGGLGKPGFSTDTGVVAQAFELHCPIVVKATKVNGIYDKDPATNPDALRYERLTYQDVANNPEIKVMDRSALALAADKQIAIAVCSANPEDVLAILNGDISRGSIIS
jgi:uridylate kinase